MAGTKRLALNVVMNWVAMAVGMVVPFFLTPFVLRHLGPSAYGVWILAVSTVSYLNLLDMGLRSAIVRFVSKGHAQGEVAEVQTALGAAIWFRVLLAGVVAVISVALAIAFPYLFKVPPDLQHQAQVTVLLCALGVAITMLSGVFGGVLSAIHRFDVSSTITVGQTLARAAGVLVLLGRGYGLIALAWWEFAALSLAGIAIWVSAMKLYPPCRIGLRKPHFDTLRTIWSYSFKTFIIIIAVQIVFYTDNIVVGAFVSVAAVSFYSIAGSLAMYSGQAAIAMGATFIPLASNLDALGQSKRLRELLVRGTQAALALSLPITVTLYLRGKTFIGLWMGPQYSQVSGTVLQILLISQFFTIANATAGQVAFGVDKHKSVAKWATIEAVFNLVLSIVLVKTIGIYGVAWGTAISQAIIHLIFWPRYVSRELGVPVRVYLLEGWGKITLTTAPYALACYVADMRLHPANLAVFFLQVIALLPVFIVSVALAFQKEIRGMIAERRSARMAAASPAS